MEPDENLFFPLFFLKQFQHFIPKSIICITIGKPNLISNFNDVNMKYISHFKKLLCYNILLEFLN